MRIEGVNKEAYVVTFNMSFVTGTVKFVTAVPLLVLQRGVSM